MKNQTGVFSQNDLASLVENGRIKALQGFRKEHIGPASIDLTIAGEGLDIYHVQRVFRPRSQDKESVKKALSFMGAKRINPGQEMITGHEYIAKSSVEVNFPPGMYGYTNAKSTSGRNFLLSRTLADNSGWFDSLDRRNEGYSSEVWLVLQPLVYSIVLSQGECYSQLRVFDGDTRFNETDLRETLEKHDLLYRRDQKPYKQGELSLFSDDGSVFCTLYAKGKKFVGFRVKNTHQTLNLSEKNVDPKEYFEPVYAEEAIPDDPDSGFVKLRAGDYYLFSTNEMLKVPNHLCAELKALDPRLGLFFSHFAGFFDPGFFGTATLEILAPHDMVLRHKDPVARFVFERMRSETVSYKEKGNYHGQIETRLPKQFAPWK